MKLIIVHSAVITQWVLNINYSNLVNGIFQAFYILSDPVFVVSIAARGSFQV